MKCSLTAVLVLVLLAIACLLAAMGFAAYGYAPSNFYFLFIAAGFVAVVSFVLISAIKNALSAYATCRGSSEKCSIASAINNLGQLPYVISAVTFAIAGALQIAAVAALLIWIFGAAIAADIIAQAATLITAGIISCGAGIVLLVGVLTDAYGYQSCMDQQGAGSGPPD
jgi:hypothetical protein